VRKLKENEDNFVRKSFIISIRRQILERVGRGIWNMWGRGELRRVLVRNLKEIDHLKYLSVDGRVTLKQILMKCRLDSFGSRETQVAGSCGRDNVTPWSRDLLFRRSLLHGVTPRNLSDITSKFPPSPLFVFTD
jgi:hypothetical protein